MLETDPIDFALDADGDLLIEDGDAVLSSGISGVAQEVRIAVLLFRGEWFLDLDAGVPYYQDILGQKFNATQVSNAYRDAIGSVPSVAEILALDVTFDGATRTVTVTWQVRTAFGDKVSDVIAVGIATGVVQ